MITLGAYTDTVAYLSLAVLIGMIGIVYVYFTHTDAVKVLPVWRKESRGLSQRSRRDIAVALTAAVVSAAIIAIAGLWAGIFVK